MSYEVDYTHLQNLIMGAVQKIAEQAAEKGEDATLERYSELIQFLESQYCNTIVALVGSMLATAKFSTDAKHSEIIMIAAREIMDTPSEAVELNLHERYQEMIKRMNLPDIYTHKTHNEQVAEEILQESADEAQPESRSQDN